MSQSFQRPATINVIRAIARVTLKEILRDRVLYNVILCSILLFGVGFLASRLASIRPERVLLDFGLSAVRISSAMIAILTGATLIAREIERRTLFVALSKPIGHVQFVAGKYAGLASVLFLNWLLLSAVYMTLVLSTGGEAAQVSNSAFAWALVFALLESWVLGAIAILFSAFSTTSLAVIITIGFYLVGHNITQILQIAARIETPGIGKVLTAFATLLPNLEHFEMGTQVTYSIPVGWKYGLLSIEYAGGLILFLVIIAGALLKRRST